MKDNVSGRLALRSSKANPQTIVQDLKHVERVILARQHKQVGTCM